MSGYEEKIQELAKSLLEDKKVDMVIGFRQGTVPMIAEPCSITGPAEADTLVWGSFCGVNLANYLPKQKGKIGIVAKGCDSRNIVNHIVENQISRDQLVIIGVPCTGMVDRRKLKSAVSGKEILKAAEQDGKVTVSGEGFEESFNKQDMLQDNCAICAHRNPVLYDELAGELVEEQDADRYEDVRQVEAMAPEEKWAHFNNLVDGCIRCYACRNACPLCYCPTCFVDESQPQWVGKSIDPTDTLTFHFLRAYHCAGRCTDCGACERACPVGIEVRQFTKKLEKDSRELYDWEAGLDPDARPPLDAYKLDDPNDFIK